MIRVALFDCGIIKNENRSRSLRIKQKIEQLGFEIDRIKVLDGEKIQDLNDYSHYIVSGSGLDFDTENLGIQYVREELLKLDYLGKPVLGICFGSQLIASTFGGTVIKRDNTELGFCKVNVINFHNLIYNFNLEFDVFQYHFDYIQSLPDEALLIGESGKCIQAYSYKNFYGVQFHPEVDSEFADSEIELIRNELDDSVRMVDVNYVKPQEIFKNFLNIK